MEIFLLYPLQESHMNTRVPQSAGIRAGSTGRNLAGEFASLWQQIFPCQLTGSLDELKSLFSLGGGLAFAIPVPPHPKPKLIKRLKYLLSHCLGCKCRETKKSDHGSGICFLFPHSWWCPTNFLLALWPRSVPYLPLWFRRVLEQQEGG